MLLTAEVAKRSDKLGALIAALPTLPMFLMFPFLMARFSFWPSLGVGAMVTIACFASLAAVMKKFGIFLL